MTAQDIIKREILPNLPMRSAEVWRRLRELGAAGSVVDRDDARDARDALGITCQLVREWWWVGPGQMAPDPMLDRIARLEAGVAELRKAVADLSPTVNQIEYRTGELEDKVERIDLTAQEQGW